MRSSPWTIQAIADSVNLVQREDYFVDTVVHYCYSDVVWTLLLSRPFACFFFLDLEQPFGWSFFGRAAPMSGETFFFEAVVSTKVDRMYARPVGVG